MQALGGPWALVIAAFVGVLILIIAVGVQMLASDRADNLGAELIGGGIIGLALLGAEIGFGLQLRVLEKAREVQAEEDRKAREVQAERESLRLQLGISTKFPGIDLSGKNLSGFYLRGRDFSNANLQGTNMERTILRDAIIKGSDLLGANLQGADIQNVDLTETRNLSAAELQGALYSETTRFPDHCKPSKHMAPDGRCRDHPPDESDHWHYPYL